MSAEGHDDIWLPGRPAQQPARRAERRADAGVAANARLTASNAVVLLVLLAAEGVTILRVRELLTPHVFIGMVLIPPVLLKVHKASFVLWFGATTIHVLGHLGRCSGWLPGTGCGGHGRTSPGPPRGSG